MEERGRCCVNPKYSISISISRPFTSPFTLLLLATINCMHYMEHIKEMHVLLSSF